jgi:hypothetical protein
VRRIALGVLALGVLAAAPAASAASTECTSFDYHGYHVRGVRAVNLSCHDAHGIARGYVDHGQIGGYSCSRSFLPHDVTEVLCSRQDHGEKSGAHFGIQPIAHARAAAITSCGDLVYHGYDAVSVRESGVGCTIAHEVVKHSVDHGATGLRAWTCDYASFSGHRRGERWTCRRESTFVTFVLYLRHDARGPTH